MNNCVLVGRLTKDLELLYTQSNKAKLYFTIAINRDYKNSDGEYEADFIRCLVFGKIAETMNQYCKKGDMVGVCGRIQTGKYQDKDGNTKYTTEVLCNKIKFLGQKNKKEEVDNNSDPFSDFGEQVSLEDNFLED